MKHVLYVQNGESDGPALLGQTLAGCEIALTVIHAWNQQVLPADLSGFDALAVGGGSMSVYEEEAFPFLRQERALIRTARREHKPVLGICLGAQLLASAFGGAVFANTAREIGIFELTFTPEACSDPLWKGCESPLMPVHWHGDTFSLPAGATLLASSALTANQLFRIDDNLYGLQFHLEIDLALLGEMIATDAEVLTAQGVDPDAFLRDGRRYLPAVEPLARTVFARWAALLNFQPQPPYTP